MAFGGDVARLKKLTREVLLREVLGEFGADDQALLEVIDSWRRFRNMSNEQLEHYAAAEECGCAICTTIEQHRPTPLPSRSSLTGEAWVTEMVSYVEKWAPGMTPAALKKSLAFYRLVRDRSWDELWHFAREGFFPTHTPEQAEAEGRFIDRFCK